MRLLLVRLEKDMVAPVSSFAAKDGSSTSGQRRPGFCIMPRAVSVTSSIFLEALCILCALRLSVTIGPQMNSSTRPKGRSSSSTESTKCMDKEDSRWLMYGVTKNGGDTSGISLS